MNIIVHTPRLLIRQFLPDEETIYLNHFTDEMVTMYLPKRSKEERTGIFRKALDQYQVNKNLGIWGIFNIADGDFIGSCLLRPFNNGTATVELGYSIERKYWGMGLGTEMAASMVAYGFTDINTLEIVAVTVLDNTGSQRVLEKAGMIRGGNILKDSIELAYFKIQRIAS